MKSIQAFLAILTAVTLAACADPEPPPCPVCPDPVQPPLSLAWEGVPEDLTEIPVGERETLTVRLTPAIDADYSFGTTATNIAVTSSVTGTGVIDVTIVALEVGEATVNLVAEAPGYEIARASFDVVVERKPLFGQVVEGFVACQEFEDMDQILELFETRVSDDVLEAFFAAKLILGECGVFEDGDEIRWDGEEVLRPITGELASEFGSDSISVIQVWGTPYIGAGSQISRAPHGPWWIWRIFTTFHEGPRPPAATRFGLGQR